MIRLPEQTSSSMVAGALSVVLIFSPQQELHSTCHLVRSSREDLSDSNLSCHPTVWNYLTTSQAWSSLFVKDLLGIDEVRCFLPGNTFSTHLNPTITSLWQLYRDNPVCARVLVHGAALMVAPLAVSTARPYQQEGPGALKTVPFLRSASSVFPHDPATRQGQRWRIPSCVWRKFSLCLDNHK